ncbi:hypothetical protein DFJ43DRAFT_1042919 [Lentinula guzmanii]|uniref:Uncharacterized protein n=1 Tax=Lentinula guzmanii TaxID=2804957 RepID=A0AA38J8Z9_9AGAR|nr:hypothetical protein DFJ43DRAFT_1042919 [Lentinula guzmanii]
MPITPAAAFFAPDDFPELSLNWGDREFEIVRGPDETPFRVTVDELITTIQTSLALGRGWKICVIPCYPEIARVMNHTIPGDCDAYLSYIKEGHLYRSKTIITYSCYFNASQLATLRDEKKISDSLNRDTTTRFPKPPRREVNTKVAESITGATLANFTKTDMDQSILFAGLMAHARETQRKNLWKLKKQTTLPKATRGAERYAISESGSQSTTMGLNAKISKWRLTSTKNTAARRDEEDMDTASCDVETNDQEGGPSGEGPSNS